MIYCITRETWIILCLSGILLLQCAPQSSTSEDLIFIDFAQDIDDNRLVSEDATYEVVDFDQSKALKVSTGTKLSKPGVVIKQDPLQPWNLQGYYQVKADVSNVGDETIQVEMFVGNDPDGLTRWYCSDYVDLNPGESKTITVNLSWTPWVHQPQLEIVGMRGVPGKIKTDISAIEDITFYSRYATQENQFLIHQVRAIGEMEVRDTAGFFPFVDVFGQYKHREWQDKTHSEEDLEKWDKRDLDDISANPAGPDRDQYGGWSAGPQLEATGWCRAEKVGNKWWMVDPEGHLFWSAGIVCALTNYGMTGVEGREKYFENLPEETSDLGKFYTQGSWSSHGFYQDKVPFKGYNFYEANLYRKYGENWKERFHERLHQRFDSWGMNTFGNVSDMEAAAQQKTPYVGTVWIEGTPKIAGSSGYWGKFHDVFDPNFRTAVRKSMERQQAGAGDPWCIGFFVDNELSWGDLGSLSLGVLQSPAAQPAKMEFVNDLRNKYQEIAALNNAWQTSHQSWDQLLISTSPPNQSIASADLNAFYQKIAEYYFKIINEELARIAPNQCYLGCRFAWANNDVTVSAAAKYCDIVSFNKYEYDVANVSLPPGVDRPVMIGEFHFGALDRGSVHMGVKAAKNQKHRGELYRSYIESALRHPLIVGAHWFQYTDQMVTGREDGENYNVGLVDVCDVPYHDFVQQVRSTNYAMYSFRRGVD